MLSHRIPETSQAAAKILTHKRDQSGRRAHWYLYCGLNVTTVEVPDVTRDNGIREVEIRSARQDRRACPDQDWELHIVRKKASRTHPHWLRRSKPIVYHHYLHNSPDAQFVRRIFDRPARAASLCGGRTGLELLALNSRWKALRGFWKAVRLPSVTGIRYSFTQRESFLLQITVTKDTGIRYPELSSRIIALRLSHFGDS